MKIIVHNVATFAAYVVGFARSKPLHGGRKCGIRSTAAVSFAFFLPTVGRREKKLYRVTTFSGCNPSSIK